jgi:hypothetical protein
LRPQRRGGARLDAIIVGNDRGYNQRYQAVSGRPAASGLRR